MLCYLAWHTSGTRTPVLIHNIFVGFLFVLFFNSCEYGVPISPASDHLWGASSGCQNFQRTF